MAGCPQQLEKMVEESLPPKDYKPVYMTSAIPFTRLAPAAGAEATGAGSNGGGTAGSGNVAMEIRTVDDSRYPGEVELRAFVYDSSGRFVMGLAPPYFAGKGNYHNYWNRLVDSCSGNAVPIDSFTVTEVRQDRREPYALSFILDHSPSMGEQRALKLQDAVRRTLRIIKPGDMVSVIKFTKDVLTEVPLTADSTKYRSLFKVDGLEGYSGGTAIFDAAAAGIEEVSAAPAGYKKALILFTDGGDNSSRTTIDSVLRLARRSHAAIYTIAYGLAEEEPLRDLAGYSGGRMYRIYSSKEFVFVFADIYRRLNNYYRITYRAPECQGLHTATAGLAIPELNLHLAADGHYDRSIFTPFDKVGEIAFVNIEFDYDKATIRPESMPLVQGVAQTMLSSPTLHIEIRGHTDDRGGDDYNQKLSEERAQAVADALASMGVDRSRLSVKGFGESRPLVPNDSEENRRKNRRTEFVITAR
jgi:outer membrane protein OmpA-like peptidoglycan-associated protein